MGNLGAYQELIILAKKVGGPKQLLEIIYNKGAEHQAQKDNGKFIIIAGLSTAGGILLGRIFAIIEKIHESKKIGMKENSEVISEPRCENENGEKENYNNN